MKATRADVHAALDELDGNLSNLDDARRKRHLAFFKDDRQRLSDNDLMFESLADRFGFDSEDRELLHLFVARSMDKSPDDLLIVNEVDIGRQLYDEDDVTVESLKRRTVRAAERVEAKANRLGKSVLERIPGKWSVSSGKEAQTGKKLAAREKKVGARYRFHWPQAIAEGTQTAKALRAGNRRGRFRRAAEVVFDSNIFPRCAPPKSSAQATPSVRDAEEVLIDVAPEETFERVTGGSPMAGLTTSSEARVSPLRIPRTVRRMKDNAALALRSARERDEKSGGGSSAFNRQAAWLAVELVRTIEREQGGDDLPTGDAIRQVIELLEAVASDPSELSCVEASVTHLEANTTQDNSGPDLMGVSSEPISRNSGQKPENASEIQDSPVQKNHRSGRLPQEFIDDVRRASDIHEVVESEGVKLTRKGSNWTACCPFHSEKTPSFHVTPAKSNFYCFGCRSGGDVFKFVQESRGVNFRDAVLFVAGTCGMSPPNEDERPKAERAPRELTVARDDEAPPEFAEVFDL
jgi:hypothetical protein